eukprot:PhF_6_TR29108/c0_g1_i1/m.42463
MYDSPSRFLTEITNYVLNGVSPSPPKYTGGCVNTTAPHMNTTVPKSSLTFFNNNNNQQLPSTSVASSLMTMSQPFELLPRVPPPALMKGTMPLFPPATKGSSFASIPPPPLSDMLSGDIVLPGMGPGNMSSASTTPTTPNTPQISPPSTPTFAIGNPKGTMGGSGAASRRSTLRDDLSLLLQQQQHQQSTLPVHFVLVEFKRARVKLFRCGFAIRPGQYVVTTGDRGEDLGLSVWVWSCNPGSVIPIESGSPGRNLLEFDYDGIGLDVRRIASQAEIHVQNHVLPALEVDALVVCREKAQQLNVPIDVIDVEYQFDRKKLHITSSQTTL